MSYFDVNDTMAGDEDVKHHDDRDGLPTEGEEEEIGKESNPSNFPCVEGLRVDSGEKEIGVGESVVRVAREVKIENELDRKNEDVEHDEGIRKSHGGDSSGSSSNSSSSDDESQGIKNRQAESNITSVDSVKVADSLFGKSVEAIHNLAEAGDSVVGNIPAADSEKITLLGEQVVESAFKDNRDKKPVDVEIGSSKEEAIVRFDENTSATSDLKECATQEGDDRSTSSYNAPRDTASDGGEHVIEPVVTQAGLAPPFPVEKTSWKSCCGLFEVFSGSGA